MLSALQLEQADRLAPTLLFPIRQLLSPATPLLEQPALSAKNRRAALCRATANQAQRLRAA
jgi:hypothetical protein